jgi:hypothetical protein
MWIAPLPPQVERKTSQPRFGDNVSKGKKIGSSPAQSMNANQGSASLPRRKPSLTRENHAIRRLPIKSHGTRIGLHFHASHNQFSRMRTMLVNLLAACSSLATVIAGQLDVAVIQFPEEKTPAELEKALVKVDLFEMTNADRTRTTHPYLKGGSVLFAQRFSALPPSRFSTVTRLKSASADVEGHLGTANLSLSISLMEGVKAGLRTFQKKVYTGSGRLASGSPHVLGLRQVHGRSPNVVKGQTKMESYFLTTVVLAQYAP